MRRVKPDPIPSESQARILDAAIRAPSRGNAQNGRFLLVDDPAVRASLGPLYRESLAHLWATSYKDLIAAAEANPESTDSVQTLRIVRSAQYLADHFEDVPLLLFAFSRDYRSGVIDLPRSMERHARRRSGRYRVGPDQRARGFQVGRDPQDPRSPARQRLGQRVLRLVRLPDRTLGGWPPAAAHQVAYRNQWGAPFGIEIPAPLWPPNGP